MPKLVQMINSEIDEEKIRATIGFRKLLSLDNSPPIQAVIDANLVPKFIEFLYRDDESRLQFEAAWALTNITSGTHEHTKMVVDKGIVPILIKLLYSSSNEVKEQALWCIGNIAGDTSKFRDIVIDCGAIAPIIEIINTAKSFNVIKNGAWVLSNLCRGKPAPNFEKVRHCIPCLSNFLMN